MAEVAGPSFDPCAHPALTAFQCWFALQQMHIFLGAHGFGLKPEKVMTGRWPVWRPGRAAGLPKGKSSARPRARPGPCRKKRRGMEPSSMPKAGSASGVFWWTHRRATTSWREKSLRLAREHFGSRLFVNGPPGFGVRLARCAAERNILGRFLTGSWRRIGKARCAGRWRACGGLGGVRNEKNGTQISCAHKLNQ